MNRRERRYFNQKNHTSYTKQEFEVAMALAILQSGGQVSEEMLKYLTQNGVAHLDNEHLVPNGTEVMINATEILSRKGTDVTEKFKAWIEENRDKVFHLTREENSQSLVCFEEDNRVEIIDGIEQKCPKWLFDLYSDILIKYEDRWIPVYEYDTLVSQKEEPIND